MTTPKDLAARLRRELVLVDVRLAERNQAGRYDEFLDTHARRLIEAATEAAALLEGLESYQEKSERVFQAVVYAFEGKEVPADLLSHGMVRRALKYRAGADPSAEKLRDLRTATDRLQEAAGVRKPSAEKVVNPLREARKQAEDSLTILRKSAEKEQG